LRKNAGNEKRGGDNPIKDDNMGEENKKKAVFSSLEAQKRRKNWNENTALGMKNAEYHRLTTLGLGLAKSQA